jgi:hypothetical protein
MGWVVGDTLVGDPILNRAGEQIERGLEIRLTAIGEHAILARRRREGGSEDTERSFVFTEREWRRK